MEYIKIDVYTMAMNTIDWIELVIYSFSCICNQIKTNLV